jgi:hypothetical protein
MEVAMRRAILGVVVGAALAAVVAWCGQRGEAVAQRVAYPAAGTGDLIAMQTPMGEHGQALTIVDPRQQTIGVYAIDLQTGKITLRGVRSIHWDLLMMDFNGERPLPREIRMQLEQR